MCNGKLYVRMRKSAVSDVSKAKSLAHYSNIL